MGDADDARVANGRRWPVLALGVLATLVGAALIVRPFASLGLLIVLVIVALLVTGVGDLADARRSGGGPLRHAAGVAWIAAAVVVAAWPGVTLAVLARIVGVALVIGGAARALAGVRGPADRRLVEALLGAASVLLGLVALAWPDVTAFVIGVAFGVRMVLFGISQIVDAVRGDRDDRDDVAATGRRAGLLGAVGGLVLAVLLFGVSTRLNATGPDPDAFYDPPADLPTEPGHLVRSEPFTREVPDGARAWRILYTTTRGDGTPAIASGLVVVPDGGARPHPVITWAHGTTGQGVSCAPSLLPEPWESGALFVLDEVVHAGWALVAADYTGLGADPPHAYLVGEDAGRSVLDATRAARELPDVELAETTVVRGHSQGGASALWAGTLATAHAPDAGVIGVAAMSAASNLPAFVDVLEEMPGGSIFASYVITGYAAAYDDVDLDRYVRPAARLIVREMAARCLSDKGILVSVIESLVVGNDMWAQEPSSGPLAARLEANVPTGAIDVPLLMTQGLADTLILPEAQRAYVDGRCGNGGNLEYRTYAGLGHVDVVQADSPLISDLLAWTRDRFAGEDAATTCP